MRPMRFRLFGQVVTVTLLAMGCTKATERPGPASEQANLKGRLTAVSNISVPQARDPMAGSLARDAASLGQAGICVEALGKMSNAAQRLSTAKDCAETLTKKGDTAGAARVSAVQ